MAPQAGIQFGKEVCGNLAFAEEHEWLITNGIGGYASGTVAGTLTRRYHGLLIAALQPPLGRTQLVTSFDETAQYAGRQYSLGTQRWASGAIEPQGFLNIESFHMDGTMPVWTYALADASLEKRVWMRHGENTTFIQYSLARGSGATELSIKALVNYRDFHGSTHAGDWHMDIAAVRDGVRVQAFNGATPFYLRSNKASCEMRHDWYRDCLMPEETARALDDREDHLLAAVFRAKLELASTITFVVTTEAESSLDGATARAEFAYYEADLFHAWQKAAAPSAQETPSWIWPLISAADQFIVKRALPQQSDGHSVLAGYHWFDDWGRDAMIALPGLTIATGRSDIAKHILLAFAHYVDGGMLPNNFPNAGGPPQYNTVDAALWFFEAIRQYFAATRDLQTLQMLLPIMANMVDAHVNGTRFNIHVDPADGLLCAGAANTQLTWMDAKVGDAAVTPRVGKPVEVNALWINALETMTNFARLLAKPTEGYAKLSARAQISFQKFWNADRQCCYDVIDVPDVGKDASLRPNQIFCVSLPFSPLYPHQQKAVVDICREHLLTPYGLRSLAPSEPGYCGHYRGRPGERDTAYHQGTVWEWLLGPFVSAHLRVYRDRSAALRFLEPVGEQIRGRGLGTLPEIFDGDFPHAARGCIAQAWTVAEVLRAWKEAATTAESPVSQELSGEE